MNKRGMQNKSYVMKEIVCKLRFRENVEFEMDKTNMSYPKQEFWKDPDRIRPPNAFFTTA